MPRKNPPSLFQRLTRLRARLRRLRAELSYLAQIAGKSSDPHTARDLKIQLRDARDQLRDAEDLLEPQSNHVDLPLGAAAVAAA